MKVEELLDEVWRSGYTLVSHGENRRLSHLTLGR